MNGVNFFLRMRDRVSRTARRTQGRLRRLEWQTQRLQRRLNNLNMPGNLGAAALGAASFALVKVASDANEMRNQFGLLFTDSATGVSRVAEVTAELEVMSRTLNRSQTQLMGTAGTFQSLGKGLGFTFDEATRLSTRLTGLSVDFASFYNMSDADAAQRLTSGLKGNHEALEAFNVFINASTMDQRLKTMFGVGNTAATEQQKTMARLAIIMDNTQNAQGDATRTAQEFANKMRGLRGRALETADAYGKVLIPIFEVGIDVLDTTLRVLKDLPAGLRLTALGMSGVAVTALPMLSAFGFMTRYTRLGIRSLTRFGGTLAQAGPILARFGGYALTAIRFVGGLGAALFRLGAAWLVGLGPLGWGIIAITAIVGAAIYAYNRFEWFRNGVHSVLTWFKGAWQSVADWVPHAFSGALAWLDALPERMMNLGGEMIAGLKAGIQARIGEVKASITGVGDEITGRFRSLLGIQSPSRVFMGYGRMIPAGLEKGITQGLSGVSLAPQLSAALPNPVQQSAGRSGGQVGAITIHVNGSQRPDETARAVRDELTNLFSSLGLELGVTA